MNPQEQFRHNPACWAYGCRGAGHVVIHSRRERRYRGKRCRETFGATTGTALHRAHTPHGLVVRVVARLAYGCPVPALVAAFGLDERTVARYRREAGAQGQCPHEQAVAAGRVASGQAQAGALRVRIGGGVLWVAMALAVSSWWGRAGRSASTATARCWCGCAPVARREPACCVLTAGTATPPRPGGRAACRRARGGPGTCGWPCRAAS